VITPGPARLNCDYLTIRGIVTKDLTYGDLGGGRWDCPFVIDPSRPSW
jgi:hypothetical protein